MFRLYWVVTFFDFILVVVFSVHDNDNCRQLDFDLPIFGKILAKHVIRTIEVPDVPLCQLNCFLEADCVSVNVRAANHSREKICELNNKDANGHPEDLMVIHQSSYHGTKNACSSNPCRNGAMCQTGFTKKGYRCLCPAGSFCTKARWIKINTSPVCFGARHNSYGVFKILSTGHVISFKLVHLSGYVVCSERFARSKWGCKFRYPPKLAVFVTDHRQQPIFPPNNTVFHRFNGVPQCANGIYYSLPGYNEDSRELKFNNFSSPKTVTEGQEFQIWYGEDLKDCTEDDNDGQSCVDIHGLYV
ncbi:uncharacterized protein LOC111327321 [Stylophora pistillata]|uniref:uncharacterized protein LOC111327321 n=1 Tax=Stylophora pistillata TaxID=50429 RepID=UPI000C045C06|nr:uncharacterized protein LOC111327321 [Stylophora pistillata]